jgi:tRNA nucleotidyltransferase (CCA-adding enzyme)
MTDDNKPPTRSGFPFRVGRLDPPEAVREIVARLERAGFECWCVGGAVRDALLGHPHLDWDFATIATPAQVMSVFKRTVPVGVEYGTVGVFDSQNTMHEVTTFRRDVNTDGRHAVVEFGASLDDDLARRDFTVNAIAYHPKRDELRDPFDGQLDIRRGVIRAVGTASERMREDRLRALRGIRFASRFSFHIEPATWAAIKASAPHMGRLSPERVKQELEKTMEQVERPSIALEWWREAGFLRALVPSIADAPAERFAALDHLPRGEGDAGIEGGAGNAGGSGKGATLNRLAMLFFGEREGAVAAATKALRFSNADSAWIASLAGARAELGSKIDAAIDTGPLAAVDVRRWVARIGRMRAESFFTLTAALWRVRLEAAGDADAEARLATLAKLAVIVAFRDPIEIADLAVDGEDLRKAGIPDGPRMGKVLHALLQHVISDPALNTNAKLLELARAL